VKAVVERCRQHIELSIAEDRKPSDDHKSYRQVVSDSDSILADDIIMQFVLSDGVLDIAMGYLGQVPVLQKYMPALNSTQK